MLTLKIQMELVKEIPLFIKSKKNITPALVIKYLSSSSAACEKLNGDDFKSGLVVYAILKNVTKTVEFNHPHYFRC